MILKVFDVEISRLWRHSSICVNKVRQPRANIRIGHVIKLILNKCNKIHQDVGTACFCECWWVAAVERAAYGELLRGVW